MPGFYDDLQNSLESGKPISEGSLRRAVSDLLQNAPAGYWSRNNGAGQGGENNHESDSGILVADAGNGTATDAGGWLAASDKGEQAGDETANGDSGRAEATPAGDYYPGARLSRRAMKQAFEHDRDFFETLKATPEPGLDDAFVDGLQDSVIALAIYGKEADKLTVEERASLPFLHRMARSLGTFAGDSPVYLVGGAAGGPELRHHRPARGTAHGPGVHGRRGAHSRLQRRSQAGAASRPA